MEAAIVDKWGQISDYLERLTAENERLEKDLVAMKKRRLERKKKQTFLQNTKQHTKVSAKVNKQKTLVLPEIQHLQEGTRHSMQALSNMRVEIHHLLGELKAVRTQRLSLEQELKKLAPPVQM